MTLSCAARPQQVGDDRAGVDDLLEVVEDEQDAPVAQPVRERLGDRAAPLASVMPTAAAIRGATSIGSRIGSSGTKKTPSGKSSADGRRQLQREPRLAGPAGPGQGQQAGRREAAGAASASSASRPTNVVSWVGRLFGRASGVRSGGKSRTAGRRPRPGRAARARAGPCSRYSPRSRRLTPAGSVLATSAAGRVRDEDLAAVADRRDPRGPVDVEPDEAAAGLARLAGVEAHPDAIAGVVRPRLGGERALRLDGRRDRRPGAGEDDEERVALGALLDPGVRGERRAQDRPMALAELARSGRSRSAPRGGSSPRCR